MVRGAAAITFASITQQSWIVCGINIGGQNPVCPEKYMCRFPLQNKSQVNYTQGLNSDWSVGNSEIQLDVIL
jgi:hypothetical protein